MIGKLHNALNLIEFYVYNRIGSLFMPLDDNRISFLSESHLNLDGNLKAVHDELDDSYDKHVFVKADRRERDGIDQRLKIWKSLTTSKYIILDDFYGLTSAMKIRSGQELVQLWHGSGAFKKFGFSRINTGDNIRNINSGYRKYTKVAVTSENARPCFAEAFDISLARVQAVGSPRTDIFFDKEKQKPIIDRVYSKYPILRGKKVVLLAPTYRGRKVEDADYDFEKLNIKRIADELGNDYCIVTKWHPALYNNIIRGKVSEGYAICETKDWTSAAIIDASDYGDINDLLLVTDVLVTDYSSVIFDYFLLNKPVIYFAYDLDEYDGSRGLYFDFDTYVYGEIATDSGSLINAIKEENLCEERRDQFNSMYMHACKGNSTQNVINWIFEDTLTSEEKDD